MKAADNREGGFVKLYRRILSSPLYSSLTPGQRSVFLTVLLRANWRPSQVMHAGAWHTVERGELVDSLAALAERSRVSIKVVRSALAKMLADDGTALGRGPFLSERWTGREKGTGLRVLTVCRYSEYQDKPEEPGTGKGTAGARQGHATGTAGAPSEEVEEREEGKEVSPPAAPPAGKPTQEREPASVEELRNDLREARRKALPTAGPDNSLPPGAAKGNLRRLSAEHGADAIKAAFALFLEDDWARGLTPRCPLQAFVSEKVLPRFLELARKNREGACVPFRPGIDPDPYALEAEAPL